MKYSYQNLVLGFGFFVVCSGSIQADSLPILLEKNDGIELEKQNDYLGALVRFKVDLAVMEKIHEQHPDWNQQIVTTALADYREKIAKLEPLANKQFRDRTSGPTDSGFYFSSLLYDNGLKEPDTWRAMNDIEEYLTTLEFIQREDPQWETGRVRDRIKSCELEMDRLEEIAIKTLIKHPDDGHTVQ